MNCCQYDSGSLRNCSENRTHNMNEIVFYDSTQLLHDQHEFNISVIPGIDLFKDSFEITNRFLSFVDRTKTIRTPVKTKVLDIMLLPEVSASKEFAEICDQRALSLMHSVIESGRKLAIMYSGGVDSTTIVCALLKNFTEKELKEHVIILLSNESVYENRDFYYRIINTFNCLPSNHFTQFLNNDNFYFVLGEHCDQLFGSKYSHAFSSIMGNVDLLFDDINPEVVSLFFRKFSGNPSEYTSNKLTDIFLKVAHNSPIKIDTHYKFFWWINFTCKWQSVYLRSISFLSDTKNVKLEENYTTFFSSPDFQNWSMNNCHLLGDPSKPYKWVAKEYIFDVMKDKEYMNKRKIGSFAFRYSGKPTSMFLDVNFTPSNKFDINLFDFKNDFV